MSASAGPDIITNGLVLCLDAANRKSYPGSGNTWRDLAGRGLNGTLTNGPTFNSSNGGNIAFDGANDYSRINSFSGDSNLALSVFCWVYPKNLRVQQFGGNYLNWIINKRNTISPNSNSWQFITSNSYPTVSFWDSNNNSIMGGSSEDLYNNSLVQMQINQWYQVGFVTNGVTGGYSDIYLNGVLNFSRSLIGNRGIETKPIDIGRTGWDDGYFWNGNIAQAQIYNRALTPQEVLQNYNATKGRFGLA